MKSGLNLVKKSINSIEVDGCQYQEYDKTNNVMRGCGKPYFSDVFRTYCLCEDHYNYSVSLGFKVKEKKKS